MAVSRRLLPVDIMLLGYLAITALVAGVRMSTHPRAVGVLVANGLMVALILLVTRQGLGRVGRLIRDVYPLVLLLALYAAVDLLNGGGAVATYDHTVQGWEQRVFGGQVSREWWQRAPSVAWSSIMHGAYFAYYLLVPLPVAYFAWRGDAPKVRRSVLLIMATFLACYLVFIFFPVAGPYYEFERPEGLFVQNLPARLVYGTLSQGSAYGAAFPSSHVAATASATIAALLGAPRLGLVMLLPAGLLTIGVVYTQMHYAVDVLAGLLVAGVVGVIAVATSANALRHNKRPPPSPAKSARVLGNRGGRSLDPA